MSFQAHASDSQPKLLIPGLAAFYAGVSELSYLLIRVVPAALLLVMHGWGKLMAGSGAVSASMAKYGFYPPTFWAYLIMVMETIGAVCLILGLFTRFFAAALAIQMAVLAFYVHAPWGLAYNSSTYQLVFTWCAVFLAIALRGGGPYSLDRKLGHEL